jgi:hypothetical protein
MEHRPRITAGPPAADKLVGTTAAAAPDPRDLEDKVVIRLLRRTTQLA